VVAQRQRARGAHLVPAVLHLHGTRLLQADAAQLLVVVVVVKAAVVVCFGCGARDALLPLPVGFHESPLQERLGLRAELADELERGRPHHWFRRRRVQQRGALSVAALEGHRVGDPPRRVPVEAVSAPGEELPDAVQVAAACSQVQRRAAGEAIGGCWGGDDGAGVEQVADALRPPLPGRQVQRRGPDEEWAWGMSAKWKGEGKDGRANGPTVLPVASARARLLRSPELACASRASLS
jgi:hypothetical protein